MELLCNYLEQKLIINENEIPIIIYGMKTFLLNFSTILSTLLISHVFKNVGFGIYFLLFFIPIRTTMGGYHCHTALKCFIIFNIIIITLFSMSFEGITLQQCLFFLLTTIIMPCHISDNKKWLNRKKINTQKMIVIFINFILLIVLKNLIFVPFFIASALNIFLLSLAYINESYMYKISVSRNK